MKKSVMFGLVVAIMSTSAFGIVGTPTAELDKGRWNFGFNYTYNDIDMADTKGRQSGMYIDENDESDEWASISKVKLKEFKIERNYVNIGHGIRDNWEIYVQLGFADTKEKEKWFNEEKGQWYRWLSYNPDPDFAFGWGTRITLLEQGNMKWGASAQMNFHDAELEERKPSYDYYYFKESTELETWDILIAAGPTVDMGGWKLYGGGFFYDFQGDISWKGSTRSGSYWKGNYDFEADGNFGGFVGTYFTLYDTFDITTEFSATTDSWSIGFGVSGKF